MKFLKNIATTGLIAATAIGFAVVAQPQQAQAASLRFVPSGGVIDGNPADPNNPLDYVTSVGAVETFKLFFDAPELVAGQTISQILFRVNWDPTELGNANFNINGVIFNPARPADLTAPVSISGPVSNRLIASLTFNVLAGLNNDETRDLWIRNVEYVGTNLGRLTIGEPSDIEVQGVVPTPALLPGVAAMGMGLLRKRKKAQEASA
jgi:hypothetical protein